MSTAPLLDANDFTALLTAGAAAFLARQYDVAGPDETGLEHTPWQSMPFQDRFDEFAGKALGFFGLPNDVTLFPEETPAESGRRLHGLWLAGPRAIVFHTSGSTGEPRPWPHSEALLRQEATAVSGLFPGIRRVVSTAPPFHSYGFIFGFLMPRLAGLPRAGVPPLPTFLAGRLREGDLLVSFPLFLKNILTPPPPSVYCLSSTAPCKPELVSDLRRLGFAGLTEIYGSSETGAMASRTSRDAPFELLPHWRRHAPDTLARDLPGGGETHTVLPDEIEWQDNRRLRPVGRRDKAVQVAGVNVYPEKVAGIVRAHPWVAECAVRPMRPDEGERLKAFVVLRPDADPAAARAELRRFLQKRLEPPERPGSIAFGPALPRTPEGKLADWD